jgi:death-on-curing protein
MIDINDVGRIHDILIEEFGGSKGIRDIAILESAISRPYQTFDGNELYPDPIDKAAAIFESIISNHPFIDGNKRTAYVIMVLILKEDNLDIDTNQNIKYDFVIRAAKGEIKFNEIRSWLKKNIVKDYTSLLKFIHQKGGTGNVMEALGWDSSRFEEGSHIALELDNLNYAKMLYSNFNKNLIVVELTLVGTAIGSKS